MGRIEVDEVGGQSPTESQRDQYINPCRTPELSESNHVSSPVFFPLSKFVNIPKPSKVDRKWSASPGTFRVVKGYRAHRNSCIKIDLNEVYLTSRSKQEGRNEVKNAPCHLSQYPDRQKYQIPNFNYPPVHELNQNQQVRESFLFFASSRTDTY